MSLYVRIILETLLQLFNNFQCHTQILVCFRTHFISFHFIFIQFYDIKILKRRRSASVLS